MEVILAKTAGFCFGVKRAVDKVYEQIEKAGGPLYTYGPIIHNEQVVSELEEKGVHVVDEDRLQELQEGTIIIRSHGVGRAVQEQMERQGLKVIDVTCPFVKKIHRIVAEASAAGRDVVIAGNASHPEVKGIVGWCSGRSWVVESPEDLESLPPLKDAILVSQTTFHYKKFKELVDIIFEKNYNIAVVNTICNATQERQIEAREIAGRVDAMIVIGGSHSSNTQKLVEICQSVCPKTYFIQALEDLHSQSFAPVRSVGITAGASTPKTIIEEVSAHVGRV